MTRPYRHQVRSFAGQRACDEPGAGFEAVIPNPKLKLLDQVREVMRLRHYSIRAQPWYCDWRQSRRLTCQTAERPPSSRMT